MTTILAFLAGVFVGVLLLAAALILLSANHAPRRCNRPAPIDREPAASPPPPPPRGWSQVHPGDKPTGKPPMIRL